MTIARFISTSYTTSSVRRCKVDNFIRQAAHNVKAGHSRFRLEGSTLDVITSSVAGRKTGWAAGTHLFWMATEGRLPVLRRGEMVQRAWCKPLTIAGLNTARSPVVTMIMALLDQFLEILFEGCRRTNVKNVRALSTTCVSSL
jgi:hypothetical protein